MSPRFQPPFSVPGALSSNPGVRIPGRAHPSRVPSDSGRFCRSRRHRYRAPFQGGGQRQPRPIPRGSRGVRHIVVLMMENRSFDHFLGWLPGADGRHNLRFVSAVDGNTYPNYALAPDFQGCGYSDPDHSWEGFLVQHNYGRMDGFLRRPTTPGGFPGVTLAATNTFPAGYYTNINPDGSPKSLPDLPVTGLLAQKYATLDRYFCSFAGETYPNRFYQHAAQTDRDHNSETPSTLPTIWDQLSPIPTLSGSLLAATTTGTSRSSPSGPARRSNRAPRSSTRPSFIPSPTGTRRRFRLARRSSTPARRAPSLTSASSTRPSTAAARGLRGTTTLCLTFGWASASSPTPTTHWPTTATSTTRSWS